MKLTIVRNATIRVAHKVAAGLIDAFSNLVNHLLMVETKKNWGLCPDNGPSNLSRWGAVLAADLHPQTSANI
jgi:hypothetical protein